MKTKKRKKKRKKSNQGWKKKSNDVRVKTGEEED